MRDIGGWVQGLDGHDKAFLTGLLTRARQPVPAYCVPWRWGSAVLGQLRPERLALVQHLLPGTGVAESAWLSPDHISAFIGGQLGAELSAQLSGPLSAQLAALAPHWREQGWVTGWRGELFSAYVHNNAPHQPGPGQPEWFRLERSVFRFLGLRSHAVHVNGFTADGRMWCGRRAMTKATDPGKLDNLAAGGLAAGEHMADCAVRELAEEAGISANLARHALPVGCITTQRAEAEGWHDETLWVYNLHLPAGVTPYNTDGEVSEFVCLQPAELMRQLREGAFSVDAACVIAHGLVQAFPA